jgi:hypothetical protein
VEESKVDETNLKSDEKLEKEESKCEEKSEKNEVVGIDLSKYASVEELEGLGGGVLKEELQRRGMKCGGTVHERAKRLFLSRDSNTEGAAPSPPIRSGGSLKRKRDSSSENSLPTAKVLVK